MKKKLNGFIFDMDGCLLDSINLWFDSEQYVLDMVDAKLTKEERDELNTLTLEEAGDWFHDKFGVMGSGEEVAHTIVDFMIDSYRNKVQANPGVTEFLAALYNAEAPMCVLSSSPQEFLQAGLGHADLKRYFEDDLVISAEDRGWTKRIPSTFTQVCELLGTQPADTWLFDDSWYAVQTAHETGLHVIGVHSSDRCGTRDELGRYADKVIDDFTGLNPADFLWGRNLGDCRQFPKG